MMKYFPMCRFKLIRTGNLGLSEEMEEERRPF